MAKGEKWSRLLRILNMLDRQEACSEQKMSDLFGVTRRTVFRDLEALKDAGFPIEYDRSTGTYIFERNYRLSKAYLDTDEVLALALAKKCIPLGGESLAQAFDKLARKVLETSPVQHKLPIEAVFFPAGPSQNVNPQLGQIIMELITACRDHYLVKLSYLSLYRQEFTEREVEPYYIFWDHGTWVLRAYCRLRQDWRTFDLDQVQRYEVLDRGFSPKIGEETLRQDLERGFGAHMDEEEVEIILRFSAEMRPYLERRRWHPTQTTAVLADGSLEMRLRTSGLSAVKLWLYQWIPHVEVIEPASFRRQIIEDLENQLELLDEV